MEDNAAAAINAFIEYGVPLSVGVITGEGDCYATWLGPMLEAAPFIEVASHSRTHISMTTVTGAALESEIGGSKRDLQRLFPWRSIELFIPPFNNWNYETISALVAANYTTFSPQCTASSIVPFGTPTYLDYMCTTNMYPSVTQPFFQSLDGIYHVPIGASTTDFSNGTLLPPSAVLNAPLSDCGWTSGPCSVLSQILANQDRMVDGRSATAFGVVMMHPQDWASPTAVTDYMNILIPLALETYDVYTVSDLIALDMATVSSSTGKNDGADGTHDDDDGGQSLASSTTSFVFSSSSSGLLSSSGSNGQTSSSSGSSSGIGEQQQLSTSSGNDGSESGSSGSDSASSLSASSGNDASSYFSTATNDDYNNSDTNNGTQSSSFSLSGDQRYDDASSSAVREDNVASSSASTDTDGVDTTASNQPNASTGSGIDGSSGGTVYTSGAYAQFDNQQQWCTRLVYMFGVIFMVWCSQFV